jgi:hypothetical protein
VRSNVVTSTAAFTHEILSRDFGRDSAVCRRDSSGNTRERIREVRSLGFFLDETMMLMWTLEKDAQKIEILGGRVSDAQENPRERGEVRKV